MKKVWVAVFSIASLTMIATTLTSCNEENEINRRVITNKSQNGTNELVYLGSRTLVKTFTDRNGVEREVTIHVLHFFDTDTGNFFELSTRTYSTVDGERVNVQLYNEREDDKPYPGYVTVIDTDSSQCYVKMTVEDFLDALVETREDE